jgi:hypothetical protein
MKVLCKRHIAYGSFIEIHEDEQDRRGWNLALVRLPESTYGKW